MKKLIFIAIALLTMHTSPAQQALWGGANIISPEVKSDNTVTFRFVAPNAKEVKISGEWMPAENWQPGSALMTKGDSGVWTYTTAALTSDLYGYYFIVDGLRCSDPNNVYQIRDVATVTNVLIVGNGKGDLYKVNKVPHGSVTRRWYDSPSLGMTRRITIYTPPGYETSNQSYPVLYLLHGMGGDEEAWIALGRASQILDNLIAQGKAKPMIVVMSNDNVIQEAAPGESNLGMYKPTFFLPNSMDGKFETSFKDIIQFIESSYRVKAEKTSRAICGLSMGGFHSLHISRTYPNTFDYVGLFSAAVKSRAKEPVAFYNDLDVTLKKQMENGCKLYWIGMGKTDFLYKEMVDYRAKLDSIGMKYTYVETEGGHVWTNWRVYLSEFAPLLFK
jgi:enterochelin esterase family protein